MDWNTLIAQTARHAGKTEAETHEILDSFFDMVVASMKTEEEIQFRPDFGSFELREISGAKNARGESFRKSHRTPVFKKSNNLKKQLRQDDDAFVEMLLTNGRDAQANRLLKKQSPE